MFEITNINKSNKDKNFLKRFLSFLEKISGGLEIIFILVVWIYIFIHHNNFFGLGRKEIITYILIANIFGLVAGTFLYRVVNYNLEADNENELLGSPFKYLLKIVRKGFWINLLPFFSALVFNFFLIYFFVGKIDFRKDIFSYFIIIIIIALSFIIQVLMFFIARIFAFWSLESKIQFNVLRKFKKILAGAYFPLSILPIFYYKLSLSLPFAYAFFVPTEIFLKKMSLSDGILGIWIEILWIIILYVFIKIFGSKNIKIQKN